MKSISSFFYTILLVAMVMVASGLGTHLQAQSWHALVTDSIGLNFPSVPQARAKQLYTDMGMLYTKNYSLDAKEDKNNFLYSLNIVTYPETSFSESDLDTMLLTSIDQLCLTLKSKLIYANRELKNDRPFYLFRMMDDISGQVVKGLMTFAHQRMYTAMVFTMREKSLNSDMDKFLDSFHFKE